MIISASRRTDIPAFYSEWLLERLRTGEVLVPYLRDPSKLGHVELHPDKVDCIVFWTKNAEPLLDKLVVIDSLGFNYYFSFTITGYGCDIEQRVPPTDKAIDTFLRLSDRLGQKRVDWRYDPIMIDANHSLTWHSEAFESICRKLQGATERCIINFIKSYRHLPQVSEVDDDLVRNLAGRLAEIAASYEIPLYCCTEARNLEGLGIEFSSCIDKSKIEELCAYPITAKKDPGQPKTCRCIQSIDIGMYDSCHHGCNYCYAIANQKKLTQNIEGHKRESLTLIDVPLEGVTIVDRSGSSLRRAQLSLPLD